MKNFNLKKFLIENKSTEFSKRLNENDYPNNNFSKPKSPSIKDMLLGHGTQEEVNQYFTSIGQDMKLNGTGAYEGWKKSDFVEDFRNFINDKGLEESDEEYLGDLYDEDEEKVERELEYENEKEEYESFNENLNEYDSSELIDRMEGLGNWDDLRVLETKLRALTTEWLNEGFDKEEVKIYVSDLIDQI